MHKITSYSSIKLLTRCSLIACSLALAACNITAPTQNQSGQGSFRVESDGKPATSSRFGWVSGNWQELSSVILSKNTTKIPVEVNQVHDGSLRVLIPATDVFVGNSLRINRKSHPILRGIVQEMNARQELRMRIVGHTDSSGNDIQNQLLSLNRSNSVARYLIENGLRSSRIELEGRGSIDPLVSNDTHSNRVTNRRIEIYLYHLR